MGDLITPPVVVVDYDEIAKRVWERLIPAVPVSGAFEEKFKQKIIPYERVYGKFFEALAAGGTATYDIIPPAGETWLISFGALMGTDVGDSTSSCCIYDTVDARLYELFFNRFSVDARSSNSGGVHAITSESHARIYAFNADTTARDSKYVYSGFKVKSSSIRISKRYYSCAHARTVRHNPHSSVTLPDYIKPLEKYAFIDFEGDVSILLEKDVPLARDEKGNVVEIRNVWCKLRSFERLFAEEIADTTKRPLMSFIRVKAVRNKMGWERCIDKWREEGIEF